MFWNIIFILKYSYSIPHAGKIVKIEALRSNFDEKVGRPLPLIAHWHRLSLPLSFQIEMIKNGHPVLPWISYDRMSTNESMYKICEGIELLKSWGLPFALLTGGQWEADFYGSLYQGLPVDETGCAVDLNGQKRNAVSPLSPVEPWKGLGEIWTDNEAAKAVQSLYPNPPKVIFISNNEAVDLRWHEAETSKRWMDLYGTGTTSEFKKLKFGDGYIERYGALFQGMRDGLLEKDWKENSIFSGYGAFGPSFFGRWGGWHSYSLDVIPPPENRVSNNWHMWTGGISEFYDNNWEPVKRANLYWSMQTESMNLLFMKKQAFNVNPEFWYELIFWDGNTQGDDDKYLTYFNQDGIEYTPELYAGWVQYCMWILTPRVAREWRGHTDYHDRWWRYFQSVINSTERVHDSSVLTKFWRKGELIPNDAVSSSYSYSVPEIWKNESRWFHLTTNLDPILAGGTGDLSLHFPVRTLARKLGKEPEREFLVYAHAPEGLKTNVSVEIPFYKTIYLPEIKIGGSFYLISEKDDTMVEVGLGEQWDKDNKTIIIIMISLCVIFTILFLLVLMMFIICCINRKKRNAKMDLNDEEFQPLSKKKYNN